ncbi:hypothetical protein GCM10023200_27900 [Actinomycetospora chlora]|uniref:HicB-like protein involved in pilus formation n=1 Tax=Actinomycetospora chlora TaxID=663608 RepID=A0ABP9B661_9PSEU
MDLTPYVSSLRDDLAAAAAVGDEATTRAAGSLAAALEPAVRLALMNALSDLAGEVTEALGDRTVSLRLAGREVDVVVDRRDGGAGGADEGFYAGPSSSPFAGAPNGGGPGGPHRQTPPPPPPGPGFPGGFGGPGGPDVGDISRMTLRLVDQIKGQAEKAAAAQGMSLNSWIGQAVQGALRQHGGPRGGSWGGWDGGWDRGRGESRDESRDENWRKGWDQGAPGGSGTTGSTGSGPSAPPSTPPSTPKDDGDDGGVDGWVKG